jgi:hypothetical protein
VVWFIVMNCSLLSNRSSQWRGGSVLSSEADQGFTVFSISQSISSDLVCA